MAQSTLKYGRGLLFPFDLDGAGDIVQGQEEELIDSDLTLMMMVEIGELAWDMQAGARFQRIIDEPIDELADEEIKIEARRALAADRRMIPSKLETVRTVSEDRIDLNIGISIFTPAGAGPLLTDIEDSVRLR